MEENIQEENEENYSPYCKLCTSCGETGCCSGLACARAAMVTNQHNDCNYGLSNFRDVQHKYLIAEEYLRLIEKIRRGEITDINYFVELCDAKWDEIGNKIDED